MRGRIMKKNIKETLLSKKYGKAEIAALILYIIGTSVISVFHEPWFDESQAWLIAKSAPIKDIIFKIMHHEVHSPLWHLILAPFARLGAPFEFTISFVNIAFASAAMAVLLFKSPFPKIVRCLLPFTYFFFYQYGVTSRPYCIMMLAFMLLAVTFKNRNDKPLPYVLSLALLCLTHLYGIAIAGGIALVWVCEIFSKHIKNKDVKGIFKEKSCYELLGLALLAMFLIYIMFPAKDIYFGGIELTLADRLSMLDNIFILPSNATFSAYRLYGSPDTAGNILDIFFGAVVLFTLIYISYKNKKLMLFLVPYLITSVLSIMYFSIHHFGVLTCFFVFILWIICEDPAGESSKLYKEVYFIASKVKTKSLRTFAVIVGAFIALNPVFQSIASSYLEIKYPYGYGKALAEFLQESGLSERKILVNWGYKYDLPEDDELLDENINQLDMLSTDEYTKYDDTDVRVDYTNMTDHSIVFAYLGKNIFMNHSIDDRSRLYYDYSTVTREQAQSDFKKWHDEGLPEVIIGRISLNMIYSPEEIIYPYLPVAIFKTGTIFKFIYQEEHEITVYLRSDLFDEYPELHEIIY